MRTEAKKTGVSRRLRRTILSPYPLFSINPSSNSKPHFKKSVTQYFGQVATVAKREQAREQRKFNTEGLSNEAQTALNDMAQDFEAQEHLNDADFTINDPEVEFDEFLSAPNGDPVFTAAFEDIVNSEEWQGRRPATRRTKQERRQRETEHWASLLQLLVDLYLKWKYTSTKPTTSTPPSTQYEYSLLGFDIFDGAAPLRVHRLAESTSPALDFLPLGYLVRSPVRPTTAVSVRTLELFHRLRLRKPSMSIEAFAKVLADYCSIPYHPYLRSMVADTYEVYLHIIREVDRCVFKALGWDTPDWRVLNACRACTYELQDEPPLVFTRLWALDGNNSLKRMKTYGDHKTADTRVFTNTDYFLSHSYVNGFASDIPLPKAPPVTEVGDDDEDDITTGVYQQGHDGELGGDPTDGGEQDKVSECVRNWKAAASDDKKKMWAIFDETGIFASACRHGLILWIADMVRSGELAKYPLAIVDKAITILKNHSCGGYDIACGFEKTVLSSSIGPKYKSSQACLCVNAFHGYTHSYLCQLVHHPNVIRGAGLEDFETMERIFSASNQLATVTRYTSAYRRRLFIDTYFRQWDLDKYSNSGHFILQNYRQALKAINEDSVSLQSALESLNVTHADLDKWEQDEALYFATVGQERPWNIHAVAYVEFLQELRSLERQRSDMTSTFLSSVPSDFSFSATETLEDISKRDAAATARRETKRRLVIERYNRVLQDVISLEVQLNITSRWLPSTPEYQETLTFLSERRYQQALGKLHRLVVLRLFELHKLNLSNTGYKLRTHIAKSLQTRCKTIKRAVESYNVAAAALDPPKPPLDWRQVSDYTFVQHFTLLQETREDIRSKPWSQPLGREVLKLRRHLERAKEEITRCNVEARRLLTAIRDEDIHFTNILRGLQSCEDNIHDAVLDFVTRRRHINHRIHQDLLKLHSLPGFTGIDTPGISVNPGMDLRVEPPPPQTMAPPGTESSPALADQNDSEDVRSSAPSAPFTTTPSPLTEALLDDDAGEDAVESDDEEYVHDLGGLAQFFDGLNVKGD